MSLLSSSIGKKLVMSISGLFLIVFLVVHLCANLFLLVPANMFGQVHAGDLFNQVAHFMATNPVIRIVEPILGLGFVVHIIYATMLTLSNRKARGSNHYSSGNLTKETSFSSKNMYVLGLVVLAFLILHIWNFWIQLKITGNVATTVVDGVEMHNTYLLVHTCFQNIIYTLVYVIASLGLGYHLCHGFWSAFQTMGLNNHNWMCRLKCIAKIYAIIIAAGFSIIALAQCFCPIY